MKTSSGQPYVDLLNDDGGGAIDDFGDDQSDDDADDDVDANEDVDGAFPPTY